MADKYLLESSPIDHYQLEDGSGDYLLEDAAAAGVFVRLINSGSDVGPGMRLAGAGGGLVG